MRTTVAQKTIGRAAVVAVAAAVAAGAALWWTLGRDDPDRDCAGLRGDARIRTVLGSTWRADLPCRDLADGLSHATGGSSGVHTMEQARAMRAVVLALADEKDHHVHPDVRYPLAEALAAYAADTHAVLTGVDSRYQSHAGPNDDAWSDDRGVHFAVAKADLTRALRGLGEDPAAYGLLRAADLRQGAAGLAAIGPAPTENGILDPVVRAAAPAGVFDGIAEDILRGRGDNAGRSWRDKALGLLRTAGTDPVPDFTDDPADHLASGWLSGFAPATPDGPNGWSRLRDQTPDLLATWDDAANVHLSPQTLTDGQDRARTTADRERTDTATALKG